MINNKCEHFRVWNRLEGRTRTPDMDEAMKAELYDPLWLLARQWQFGEFQGNDCGTATSLRIACSEKSVKFSRNGQELNIDELPPETAVEAIKPEFDYMDRVEAGVQLKRIINRIEPDSALSVIDQLLEEFPVDCDEADLTDSTMLASFLSISREKAIDGVKYYENYSNTNSPVYREFKVWFEELYSIPDNANVNWNSERLEYSASFNVGNEDRISAKEYYSGNLEWHSFDLEEEGAVRRGTGYEIKEYLPTKLRYGGMPAERFWEIEDYKVDFTNINASKSDITKIVVSEYASLYSNDWLVSPLELSYGVVGTVKSIIIKDNFGEFTYINNNPAQNDNLGWNMFALQNKSPDSEADGLLMFPAIHKVDDSEPIEKVTFKRDEMANMVWAVEEVVPNRLGGGKNGYIKSPDNIDNDLDGELQYQLKTSVPLNWIPFIPVQAGRDNREMILRRGAMPAIVNSEVTKVRPKTNILQPGDIDEPYYLAEEEILKGGITVVSNYQRTRWYNGKTVNWYGYKKIQGNNLKPSGLKFDSLNKKSSLQE